MKKYFNLSCQAQIFLASVTRFLKNLATRCARAIARRVWHPAVNKIWIPAFAGMTIICSPAIAEDAASAPQSASYIFNISYEDAQDAVGKALTEKLPAEKAGEAISAMINGKKATPLYSSNKPIDVEIRGLRSDDKSHIWNASMVILSDDKVISALPLAGRYMVVNEVPVLKRQIRNGDLITDDDVEMQKFPQSRIYKDTIEDIASLVGNTPVRGISPNRPIRGSEVTPPALVKKNALVQMRYKTESMEITTEGQALANGAKGDVIDIRNVSSKKIARAVVAESNVVDVLAQGVETSQATPPSAPINY